jgi:hypothetical protein
MDELEFTFNALVGQALSQWVRMETILLAIASTLLETSLPKTGLVFYSIQNFHVWLNVIDELFQLEKRYEPHHSDWKKICEQLRQLNDMRVRLAHHTSWQPAQDEISRLATRPKLRPPQWDLRAKSKKFAPLSADEILEFMGQATEAWNAMTKLFIEMQKRSPMRFLKKLAERERKRIQKSET